MQERTLRIIDYILNQVSGLIIINTADDISVKQTDEMIKQKESQLDQKYIELARDGNASHDQKLKQVGNHLLWKTFDLKQVKQGPSLQITVRSPVIVIPDLKSNQNEHFLFDLGTVSVTSEVNEKAGRWTNFIDKPMWCTSIYLTNEAARLDFIDKNGQSDNVFREDCIEMQIETVNSSPFLLDDWEEEERIQQKREAVFDLCQVDVSVKIGIQLKIFKVTFQQSTFISFFDMLNNNVLFEDKFTQHFKSSLISQADSVQKKSYVAPFRANGHDKKTTELTIKAACLSIEMLDFQNKLICEFCIVAFDFSFEAFRSKRQMIHLYAGTLFLFHDEQDQLKQVMMGHLDAMSQVQTDKAFYEQMPQEFIKIFEQQKDKINFKLSLQMCPTGDLDMFLELTKVKLYARQQILLQISNFFISALERLDSSYAPKDETKVQSDQLPAVKKIQLHIKDTLLVLENPAVSRKCIVLQVSIDVLIKMLDQRLLKQILGQNGQRVFNMTKVDVKSLAAFFCNLDDVSQNGYTLAEKRDVLQPLQMHLDWEQSIKNQATGQFQVKSDMQLQLDTAILKLSMDDLYIFKSIAEKQSDDLKVFTKCWDDYASKSDVQRHKFEQGGHHAKIEEESKTDQHLVQIINVHASKAEALIINEQEGGYVPLFFGQCEKLSVFSESDSLQKTQSSYIQLQVGLDYFHANSGCYEPVVEQFPIVIEMNRKDKSADTTLKLAEAINFNMTIGLAACLANFQKLWEISMKNAEKFKQLEQDVRSGSAQPILKAKSGPDFLIENRSRSSSLISHESAHLSAEEQIQKMASPYAIRNLTDKPIQVYSIDKTGQVQFQEPERVQPDEMKKLVLNQNDQQKNIAAARKSSSGQGTQMDLFVKLVFAESSMRPIQWLNLNKNNSMLMHNVYGADAGAHSSREKYVLHSQLEDNRRVLTIRTLYLLRNQTKVVYHVRIFHLDAHSNQVVVDSDTRLQPGQAMPLPDNLDPSLQQKAKIAIRPSQCRKWSAEFKLQAMKDKIQPEVNVVWQHHETYSILRKTPTLASNVYDLVLQPPMIIKNCLPCKLTIDISGSAKKEEESSQVGSKLRSFLPGSSSSKEKKADDADDVAYTRNVVMGKQDEKYVQDIRKQTGELRLSINMGPQFRTTELHLLPDQAKECDIHVKICDKQGRSFNITARVDTKLAGLRIVLFCENVLISRTAQPLEFFYQKKAGVFDKDNSNQLAQPVVDEEENVIYIFQNTSELYATLQTQKDTGFSEKMQIEAAGIIGDFQIATKDKKTSFNFAFKSDLWSISETEFISTKIVEIAPQFILCNFTKYPLMFTQEVGGKAFIKLEPNQRQPYHWEDGSRKPLLLKFKPQLANVYFCPPLSLTDVGINQVCCAAPQNFKLFFKVTKRQVGQTIFIVIEDSDSPYVIRNKLESINLKVVQTDQTQAGPEPVSVGQDCNYAWSTFQTVDPMLSVEFLIGNMQLTPQQPRHGSGVPSKSLTFSLDQLNEYQTANMSIEGQHVRVFVSTYRESHFKVIEFSDKPSSQITADNSLTEDGFEEIKETDLGRGPNLTGKDKDTMTLEISQISISCIHEGHEVVTVSLHDLLLKKVETDSDIVIESYLSRVQIDNNNELDPLYPVMLKPKCLEPEKKQHDHFQRPCLDPIFQFYIHQKKNVPNILYVELVEFLVKELEVKMELDHIFSIMDWLFAVQESLNTSLTTMSPVFRRKSQTDERHFDPQLIQTWRSEKVKKEGEDENVTYIKQYKGSPLLVELSLFKQTGTLEQEQQKQQKLENSQTRGNRMVERLSNFGIKLTAINGAPIKLEALEMSNVYGVMSDIQSQLMSFYMQSLKGNVFRVAASSDLIGNPYNMVNSMGRGVKNVYYEPRDGFMKGPLQGGLGIIKGTGGLVATTGATAIGAVGKVTGVLNKGIVAVSLDRDYIHEKEINDIKNKPKNALEGVGQGVKGLGTSIFSGVTGLVTKPVQGAKQSGVGGFFGGVGKGVAGLVAKPVSGVVDLVSKTTQGVEAHVTGTPDCVQNSTRIRQPRPFYRELNIVKDYNPLHAAVFNSIKKKRLAESPFFGAFNCEVQYLQDARNQSYQIKTEILLLTQENLYALESEDLTLTWQAANSDVTGIDFLTQQGTKPRVQFMYYQKGCHRTEKKVFSFTQVEHMQQCKDQLEEIKHILRMKQDQ